MIYALILLAQEEGAKPPQPEPNILQGLVPIILMILAFVFLIVLPARRKERQQRELLFNTLKKNDEVLTSGGIIGTVANIKDDEVTLKVDESSNVRIRILRNSIIRILTPKDQGSPAGTDAVKAGPPPAK
jgi:preprotein translocase subunit YajC